jgi:hypothetical protein
MFKVLTKKGLSVTGTDRSDTKGPRVVHFHRLTLGHSSLQVIWRLDLMILMGGKSITGAIGRGGP